MADQFKVLEAEGFKMVVDDDQIATVYMVNGENRARLSYVNAWNKILDEVDSGYLEHDVEVFMSDRNTSIKGLVITGSDKYFSLGLDLDYFKTQTPEYVLKTRQGLGELNKRIFLCSVPTVAAINGHAYGAGAFLALACDYRVMRSDRGWLCWPEVALGIQISSYLILRAKIPVGRPFREAVLFGKPMTAAKAKAHELQIVDVVSDINTLEEDAKKLIVEVLGKRGIDRQVLHEKGYLPVG